MNPDASLYVNEITAKLMVDKRNLVKKIKELETEGIFTSQTRGNLKLYSLNRRYPLFKELKSIVLKTIGLENQLKTVLANVPGIKESYIYGSYARNKLAPHSDIDLLVVGDHNSIAVQRQISRLQKEIDREINAVNMAEKDFINRKRRKDPFICGILKNRYIRLK